MGRHGWQARRYHFGVDTLRRGASAQRGSRPMKAGPLSERDVAGLQAVYYLGTGVWPLLHRRSFERLTGKKTDFWLAQTVGVTVMAIGAALAQASASGRRRPPPEL